MSKIRYVYQTFQQTTLTRIKQADQIMSEYAEQGYDLTLRQLYYQFVARGLCANKQREYKKLGDAVSNGRLAGLLDWNMLVDRTRKQESNAHWGSPEEIVEAAAKSFERDKWEGQPYYVEVWVEKEALAGVVASAAEPLDVTRFSCRGYVSQSAMWRAAERFRKHEHEGRNGIILHLGDHDPSGIDMTRDIAERLRTFKARVDVKRIALNMNQIVSLGPPPNPAKLTDARAASYVEEFGHESWELDALEPSYLNYLISNHIRCHCDMDAWNAMKEEQERQRKTLEAVRFNYNEVVEFMRERGMLSD